MDAIRGGRKETKASTTIKSLVRSSTAGRDKPLRLEALLVNDLAQKQAEDHAALIVQTKVREATASAKQALQAREYEDVMDQHALQIFLVRHGKVIEESPEFQSFKRLAGKKWQKLTPFLKLLLRCVSKLGLKLVRINGSDLLKVALLHSKPSVPLVVSCLLAADDDGVTGENFLADLRRFSAVKIQAAVRRRQAMKLARRLRILQRKIRIIQQWCRAMLAKIRFKKGKQDRDLKIWEEFESLQEDLKENWADIKQVSRVEIHYAGFGGSELWKIGLDQVGGRMGSQIGRIFRAMQEKVEIIYISPKEIPDEVKKYYFKIMELAGLKLGQRRVHFVSLDPFKEFPSHFSMASRILYCRTTLRTIKRVLLNNQDCKWPTILPGSWSAPNRGHQSLSLPQVPDSLGQPRPGRVTAQAQHRAQRSLLSRSFS